MTHSSKPRVTHTGYPRRYLREPPADPAYAEAGYPFALRQAVYDRRTALALSPEELALRWRVPVSRVGEVEGAAPVPPLIALAGLASALDAVLRIRLDRDEASFVFAGREGAGEGEPTERWGEAGEGAPVRG
ncbi:transcriptional regulator [Streptomyces sp. SID11385]|uniref:transcriptional regulator n=1 Tax=Streptomyces sp. SID11385 TaxID=2706031 RepID=UPI0013C7906B|nr:transcriptional regulator [Streptomyces sp. SID11385]NEA42833.1 transcriptional regulator [Streptomyces sp. SID11385]